MSFGWLTWSNPVAIWWGFLLIVSVVNIGLWLSLYRALRRVDHGAGSFRRRLMPYLCGAYVFGCAFRSVLPRADVQRICLFDTWLSSVAIGRSVATIAELCFVAQCAIVLHELARSAQSGMARSIANCMVPLILVAECCSWYAVISTNYLGNVVENSIWGGTFLLMGAGLLLVFDKFGRSARWLIGSGILGIIAYATFIVTVNVPMYFEQWQADQASGKQLLGLPAGLHDAGTHWVVTHDVARWHDEMVWMSLYFSTAVWASLALASLVLVKDGFGQYLADRRPGAVSAFRSRAGIATQ